MNQREFYTAIVNANVSDEITAFATEAIAKMDARNAKRSATPSKAAIANVPIKASIVAMMTSEPMLASAIASALDLSVSKVSALCRQLVQSGDICVTDVKVKGKGTQKGYYVA